MEIVISYAMTFLGIQYRWGGDDPILGYDCSGFVQEVLSAFGADPKGDQTADGLYRIFKKDPDATETLAAGSLLFFGSERRITHVALAIDRYRMIEAGGGGSKCKSIEAAAACNAFIRIRPINNRKDLVTAILPFYPSL